MPLGLQWRASPGAACFYAAQRRAEKRPSVVAGVARLLAEPTAALERFLAAHAIARQAFFERLVASAATIDGNRELARVVLTKLLGAGHAKLLVESLIEPLAGLLGDCERPYFQAFPRLVDDLDLRSRPLRELWEARGPGLMAGVAKRTDPRLIVDDATVTLVQPYLGGGGLSYAADNSITFEGVLADPHSKLPETVRLAWLLSTLNTDLPDYADLFPGTASAIVSLSMLPAVLEAAADVEWVRPDNELLAAAAGAWEVPQPAGERTIDIVRGWWEFTRSDPAPFRSAVQALGRMLDEYTPGRDGPAA